MYGKCVIVCLFYFHRSFTFSIFLGGWQNNAGGGPPGQYNRGQYPPQPGPQPWNTGQRPPGAPPGQPGQWEHNRYPPQNQQQPYPSVQQVCFVVFYEKNC